MLLVIGLDGADWSILEPWLASGDLPALAALRARGVWGSLRSTIRPESSTAWSSFATGVNPARHGVFGFSAQRPDSYDLTLNTAQAVRSPTLWRRAAAAGRRVAVMNVPMTYPPQPLPGGALVAGMLSPSVRSELTAPPELRARLLAAAPGYVINVERTGLNLRDFIQQTTRAIRARGKAARWLLGQESWDAFLVTFTASDRLQHYTLHLLSPEHPRHRPAQALELLPGLLAAYRAIDDAVADLLALTSPDDTIVVLSDHGFAPCARFFHANVWLEQRGWLHRSTTGADSSGLWRRLRDHARLRRLKNSLPLVRDWRRPPSLGSELAGVDWARTMAVYSPAGGIRLNVRDREPLGALDPAAVEDVLTELGAAFLAYTDPETGARPIAAVYRREALYDGPYLALAPDLILEPRRSDPDPARNYALVSGFGDDVTSGSGEITGNHTLDGVLMAAGPDIRPGAVAGARLIDLAPTLLQALALPVPSDLDGRVLPLWHPARPVTWADDDDDAGPGAAAGRVYDEEDQAAVEARLRALGYL